jgi:hypothetical protein
MGRPGKRGVSQKTCQSFYFIHSFRGLKLGCEYSSNSVFI